MNQYIELEKRLAELKGWTKLEWHTPRQAWKGQPPEGWPWSGVLVPQWCRDNAASFTLMVEHECWPEVFHYTKTVRVAHDGTTLYQGYLPDYHDNETAVRITIVKAVITKLEMEKT